MAKEFDIPIIVLCQLSREIEKRASKKPQLSDLRESGSIEQDSDRVIFLYDPNAEENEEKDTIYIDMIIAKNRHGKTGRISLKFIKNISKFCNASGGYIIENNYKERKITDF